MRFRHRVATQRGAAWRPQIEQMKTEVKQLEGIVMCMVTAIFDPKLMQLMFSFCRLSASWLAHLATGDCPFCRLSASWLAHLGVVASIEFVTAPCDLLLLRGAKEGMGRCAVGWGFRSGYSVSIVWDL